MTIIVAITGGIGSGKSTFSKVVLRKNLKLLDSDKQVAEIYKKPKGIFLNYLRKIKLGDSIKDKKINKKIISNIIFSNKEIRHKLEKYIFKIIRKTRNEFIKKEKQKKTKIIFLDIPLLFENSLEGDFDAVIPIISPKKDRFKRLKKTKNISKNFFDKVVKLQASDLERKRKSDIVIYNNKSMKEYKIKINNVINRLIKWEKL